MGYFNTYGEIKRDYLQDLLVNIMLTSIWNSSKTISEYFHEYNAEISNVKFSR